MVEVLFMMAALALGYAIGHLHAAMRVEREVASYQDAIQQLKRELGRLTDRDARGRFVKKEGK